jgi:hypothetical protein
VCGWPIPCSEGALAHGIADLDPDGLAEAPEITDYVCRIHICQALAEFARNHGIQRRG